ncbi:hypothetical protein GE107_10095 [Cohnella sp. CFH 77786]|uniref:macrolide family glycosyltransferase n=1 Tax=Cohnella sp. CFH 77786 TaxID=2662265 RepID=UPI001C60CFFB|nr:macrolide family glycosyltransferase [Cohnella sp. CFH 77786]MBW5446410.1 hypothetical protein [Cohnella sp. CFH 77786]
MSRVVFFGIDLHGHVNPTLGLVRALVERGEEVVYYSGEAFRERIEAAGAVFVPYEEPLGFGTHDGGGIETFLITADFILRRSRAIVEAVEEELRRLRPGYIIHDAFCHWGKELARRLGIPGVSLFANFAFIDEMADLDPDFFMENVLRAGNDPLYVKNKGQADVYRKLAAKLSKVVSLKYGVQTDSVINDIFCSKEKLNLVPTSREFQIYEQAFDDSYRFIGYAVEPRADGADFPFERLDERPLVYIALGTIFNDAAEFYSKCLKAFEDGGVQVAMSVGESVRPESLGQIPDHFIVRPYVPQLELLKRSSAFVTHGGSNSIHESLCLEVPTVVVPQSFDQFMGAIAVERAGTGIYLRDPGIRPEELASAVRAVRTVPDYRSACARIRRTLEAPGGPASAADAVIAFAESENREVHRL